MPDDENVIALFYRLLAFVNHSELILEGDHTSILSNHSPGEKDGFFYLKNNGSNYTLRPLFNIEDEMYGVYATIRNY